MLQLRHRFPHTNAKHLCQSTFSAPGHRGTASRWIRISWLVHCRFPSIWFSNQPPFQDQVALHCHHSSARYGNVIPCRAYLRTIRPARDLPHFSCRESQRHGVACKLSPYTVTTPCRGHLSPQPNTTSMYKPYARRTSVLPAVARRGWNVIFLQWEWDMV